MKKYNFDEIVVRNGSGCAKWDKVFNIGEQSVLPLWVADMDFACSDEIVASLHQRADELIYGYNLGLSKDYRKVVCSWFQKRFDWKIKASSIFYAGGVVPAISYLLQCLSNPGDGIIIQTPVYYPFKMKIEATKRKVVENPLVNTNGYYTMDFVDLEEKLARADVKGLILCSPHNPVGRVWTKEELLQVIALAKKYNKWIISDEIHCDIVREDVSHIPLLTIGEDYKDEIIVCTAPSKSFNIAGLQISNIIINKVEYQTIWKDFVENQLCLNGPNSFAISATIAAYSKSEHWLNQMNQYVDDNLCYATNYLQEHLPNAILSPCEGTYLLWVDVRAYECDEVALEKKMLAASIVLDEGYLFGEAGNGFERINVACPRSILVECLERFVKVLA